MTNWDVLENAYQQATGEGGGSFTPLPTGKYQFRIIKMEFDQEKSCLERKFQVLNGDYSGKEQTDWIYLMKKDGNPNEVSLDRVKAEIRLRDPDFADLPLSQGLPMLIQCSLGQVVEGYVRTKMGQDQHGQPKEQSTIYINEFLSDAPAPGYNYGQQPQQYVSQPPQGYQQPQQYQQGPPQQGGYQGAPPQQYQQGYQQQPGGYVSQAPQQQGVWDQQTTQNDIPF